MEAVRDLMKVVPDLMEAVLIRSGGDYDLMKVVPDRDELTVGVWEGGGFEAVGEGSRSGRLGDRGGRESGSIVSEQYRSIDRKCGGCSRCRLGAVLSFDPTLVGCEGHNGSAVGKALIIGERH
ncbi:hypothetical protein L2E82_30591 [Cichorium intybus]|uniref:Uncharacterized protein n=1 Tax=Cichorium intybus TaxID=13427 RepID=A0ACB9D0Q9_CICIN|nr:hypothetical protein L2E82_30591 [Cichorium intybus]